MHIWNSIRGHFALMEGRTLHTIAQRRPFTIERVVPKDGEADWVIVVTVGEHERSQYVYITDMLKVYFMVMRHGSLTLQQAKKDTDILGKGQLPYLLAMLTTFDDIKVDRESRITRIKWTGRSELE